jgi:putative PEP-CTERM system integral membrane protein
MTSVTPTKRMTFKEKVASILFWSWNLIFLAFLSLGFAPRILPEMIIAVRTSTIPLQFLTYAVLLSLVPVAAVTLGLTVLRCYPLRLLALGYVVVGPLMLMLAVRFFIIRQATPGVIIVLGIASLGILAFLWYLLDPGLERRSRVLGWLRLVGLTLMVLTALYASLWISFYALPLAAEAFRFLYGVLRDLPGFWVGLTRAIRDMFTGNLLWVPFTLLGILLAIYTATLFVFTPLAVPFLTIRVWLNSFRSLIDRHGWKRTAGAAAGAVLVTIILFAVANRQPQSQAFELLKDPPSSREEATALLEREQAIRAGLLNAYLAPFRYISAAGEVEHIRWMYQNSFRMETDRAFAVQRIYESVASPLLYQPVQAPIAPGGRANPALLEEPRQAALLYQAFFDQNIIEAEREIIVRAVRSTWSMDQAEAAWQAVDDREVYLVRQEINVSEHGDWAEIEVFEEYQNLTANQQEVIYYFNLPESAVITGIWLGETPDRSQRFEYQVAPRGAAQTVYRNEVRRNQDPALLEQIGPRQYRLRVFPIPPVRMNWDASRRLDSVEEAPPLYQWFTYRAMAVEEGWPLPQLAEKRNIFWDSRTVRLLNGSSYRPDGEGWMPANLESEGVTMPQIHQVALPGGFSVTAVPVAQASLPALPDGLHLAVVLDRSRSMEAYSNEARAALAHLAGIAESGSDLYLTSSPFRGEEPQVLPLWDLDGDELLYFGGQNPAELLGQFSRLSAGRQYDAILVLTDGSGYDLGPSKYSLAVPEAPVWMIHLGSVIPLGYDDGTVEAIQASGGGVVGDVETALQRLAVSLAGVQGVEAGSTAVWDVLDGYLWMVLRPVQADIEFAPVIVSTGFEAIAARQVILAEMQRYRGDVKDLDNLDYLHGLAKEYSLVTPYSSMIVLVNVTQRQLLERLEKMDDRFVREYEAVGNTMPPVQGPLTGVPEPHEWLLLGLAAAFLIYYLRSNRLAWSTGRLRR